MLSNKEAFVCLFVDCVCGIKNSLCRCVHYKNMPSLTLGNVDAQRLNLSLMFCLVACIVLKARLNILIFCYFYIYYSTDAMLHGIIICRYYLPFKWFATRIQLSLCSVCGH